MLEIIGREGAPEYGEDEEPPADATPFVDPATFLEDEEDDLDPRETWLFVRYNTPDGGAIEAWVNAFYLDVRDERDRRMRLADLPTVPNNRVGEAVNTDVTPPPVPEDRVTATVFGLDPGVNLNLRRTPETQGEVLNRLSNGTTVEFLGLNEDRDWAFIQYLPSEGGSITGWVSTQYLEYGYNGREVDLEELEERELLETIDEGRRGEIGSGAPQASAPTPDPERDAYVAEVLLDPGANLHLRRSPDAASESLNLIPSGTRVIASARTTEGNWLQVTFEGQEGWIASEYIDLTFNGEGVEVEEVPLAEAEETQ